MHRRHRYTVGLMALDGKYKPHEIGAALLTQLAQGGLRVRAAVWRARQAKRSYRRRFGIETSYRQMNEGKGRTTKKDVGYRLLLVGLALLLRQVWVWLTWQLARGRGVNDSAWLAELPLGRLLDWLSDEVRKRYKEERSIELGSLPKEKFATAAA